MNNLLSLDAFDAALERKGWTLKNLADAYDRKYPDKNPDKSSKTIYPTIVKWHNGKSNPTLSRLIRIADLLDVDVDFLLGRMEEYNHAEKVIHEKTGLSYDSIEKVLKLNRRNIQSLNLLLEDDKFRTVLSYIARYQDSLSVDREQLTENYWSGIQSLISEISGNEKQSPESANQRKITDLQLQLANTSPDALEFQVDNEFRKVIEDIKKETESK